ncbi:MAG: hypothetical protein COA36_13150 [Desulfotalea sp.]|nr:MAG: hypothetical protein COA36_13150 [Desulfotalea sp.]
MRMRTTQSDQVTEQDRLQGFFLTGVTLGVKIGSVFNQDDAGAPLFCVSRNTTPDGFAMGIASRLHLMKDKALPVYTEDGVTAIIYAMIMAYPCEQKNE